MERALEGIARLKERAARVGVAGNREYNPGWHTALDLDNLLTVSEAVTRARDRAQGEPRRALPRRPSGQGSGVREVQHRDPEGCGRQMQLERERSGDAGGAQAGGRGAEVATACGARVEHESSRRETRATEADVEPRGTADVPGLARRPGRRSRSSTTRRRCLRGHGRARRDSPDPGGAGQRPGRSLELQGREVRLVLRRGERQARGSCA